jgi:M6 family metalloprotease-like protein
LDNPISLQRGCNTSILLFMTIYKLSYIFLLFMVLSACTVEESADRSSFTNCKLPIADGRGGVAIGGFPRYPERIASTGTVTSVVLFVDFSDAPATITTTQALDLIDEAPGFFTELSYGRMSYSLSTPVMSWLRMSQTSTQYSTTNDLREFLQEAVSLADASVNFSTVESIVVITNPSATAFSIGPAMATTAGQGVSADGNEILNGVRSGYDLNTWQAIWLNHEFTHNLGLVDLYAYTNATTLESSLRYTGKFSYMGINTTGTDANGPGLFAWERWVLGWLDDDQMVCTNPVRDGGVTTLITPLGDTGGVKAVVIPVGLTKALVIESRRAQGIDHRLTKEGALVYTVDSAIPSGMGPVQVYPFRVTDPLFLQAPLAVGESVSVSGFKIEVI